MSAQTGPMQGNSVRFESEGLYHLVETAGQPAGWGFILTAFEPYPRLTTDSHAIEPRGRE